MTLFWAPLKIGFRWFFASEPSPTGKIFGGYLQVATLKSSCIGLLAHTLKIHPPEFLEIPFFFQLKKTAAVREDGSFF